MFRCECQGEAGRSVANNGGGRPRKGALWREYPSSQEKDASRGTESSTNVLLFCTYLFGRKVSIILELKKTITASRSL